MAINWQYYHWHLEPSAVCAVKCPRCPRVEHPDTPWLNKNMTLEFVKKFFTENMLKNHVRRVTMCGDVGDPIYCKEYIDICRYIKQINPDIHIFTITNGSHKKPEWWAELASVLNERDTINFSIDGYDNATNNLYRVNSNFDSIINGKHWLEAAKLAGYSNPSRDAEKLFTDTRALAYAYRKTRGKIQLEGSPAAYNLMMRVMTNESSDMRIRIDIAKILFAAGGFTPPKASDAPEPQQNDNKEDMTPQAMKAFADTIYREIQRRKQGEIIDVTPEPEKQPIESMW